MRFAVQEFYTSSPVISAVVGNGSSRAGLVKLDHFLEAALPGIYLPLYTMVTFTRIPYADAARRARRQDRIVFASITAIIALLLYQPVIPGINTVWLGTIALWVAAILTLWSMFHYLRLAAPHLSPTTSSRSSSDSS